MKLIKIEIKNFRSLKNLTVDLEEYLSIIVGKNNSGKTSLLLVLDRFLSKGHNARFDIDDFNIGFQKQLAKLVDVGEEPEAPYPFKGIALRLFIEYGDDDDLGNVGNHVIMDLDPANRWIVLDFLYHLPLENLIAMKRDYLAYKVKKKEKPSDVGTFIREYQGNYFQNARRSVQYDHTTSTVQEDKYVDLIKEGIAIDDIISFKRINARRSVSNRDSDRSLSTMSANIYKAMSADAGDQEVFETFKDALNETDVQLDGIYEKLFKDVISDVRQFGGIKEGDTEIRIKSSLQHRDMLEDNTTVMYGHGTGEYVLPENYNGLGYLNLISIIFEIKILLNEFKRGKSPKPADINLLFIEEPEAHTHPQMQAIFIKNIKNLVGREIRNADGIRRPLQTVVSTHSAHIVAESDFDDIKYFKRTDGNTQSKSLNELEAMYEAAGNEGHYKFLKQYLTLHRSQLFFADKAILVEGDTERVLLPAMMRKVDQADLAAAWVAGNAPPLPLLSQNISLIEVGAHSHIYEIFLDFIGVKTLIITDIDSAFEEDVLDDLGVPEVNKKGEIKKIIRAHEVDGGTHTTNYALQFFHGKTSALAYFIGLTLEQKTVRKDPTTNAWGAHLEGQVLCVFQISDLDEKGGAYHARSFEDSFFHINRPFMLDSTTEEDGVKKAGFPSLVNKHLQAYLAGGSSFRMAEDGIGRKPSFAIEILLNSRTDTAEIKDPDGVPAKHKFEFNNWRTPKYIEEGLRWIKAG